MKRPPTPQDYAALLTERNDLRRDKANAAVVVAELRATVVRAKEELTNALTAKHAIAHELEDTRRAVARQEEEIRMLRAERDHAQAMHADLTQTFVRQSTALNFASKRFSLYEEQFRALARLLHLDGFETDDEINPDRTRVLVEAVAEKLRGTP